MIDTSIIEVLRRKFTRLASELNERGRRRWAASEALELGHGGIKVVAQATGLGERTIRRVAYLLAADIVSGPLPIRLRELNQPVIIPQNRCSRPRPCPLACI